MVSMKKIFEVFFFYYKSMGANKPRGVANLDPRGMVGRIYKGHHLTLLNIKYLSSGPHGFREEFFFNFSNYKSIKDKESQSHGWQDLCR